VFYAEARGKRRRGFTFRPCLGSPLTNWINHGDVVLCQSFLLEPSCVIDAIPRVVLQLVFNSTGVLVTVEGYDLESSSRSLFPIRPDEKRKVNYVAFVVLWGRALL
jgi:hypothetical protein